LARYSALRLAGFLSGMIGSYWICEQEGIEFILYTFNLFYFF